MDVPQLDRNRRVAGPERAEIAGTLLERYRSGQSVREICAETGYSIGRVRRMLIEAGVEFRQRGGSSSGRRARGTRPSDRPARPAT